MPMSKNLKKKRAAQAAAAREQFELYKQYIVKELVEAFGGSYQNAESMKDVWRTAFVYTPECEKFLIKKTNLFVFLMSGENRTTQGPVFFKNLIGLISEYLSVYISKKGMARNDCTKELNERLFDKNTHIQSTIKNYIKPNQIAWGLKQKERRKKTSEQVTPKPANNKEEELRKEIRKGHRKFIAFKISIEEIIR